ncbi:ABC transporter, permease protein [Formosa sp. Hel1_33_131]|nr:ABC transporter, permease protein [Formosa sp. Hel1_33_131]
MIALFLFVGYLSSVNNDTVRTIYVLDETDFLSESFKTNDQTIFNHLSEVDLETAKTLANQEGAYGLLHIPNTPLETVSSAIRFYSEESPSLSFISSLESKIENKLSELKLQNEGVDLALIESSKTNIEINQESFEGVKTSKVGSVMKLIFGGAAGYLLFMFIIIYGNMIMRSVIEEKTSRIIEVIISSVKPIQLMMGKIIGTSLAGITQVTTWIVLGAILLFSASAIFGVDLSQSPQQDMVNETLSNPESTDKIQMIVNEFSALPIGNLIVAFILFFIGGYLLYSSLYAAIGAAVDNETDTQQFMIPVLIPLIIGVYVGVFTVIEDPHGTISTVFSFIPFTSPVVMLMRIPFGVPLWEQIASLLILIMSFVVTVWFAAKIYRIGILMHGKKPTYKELYKWLKY